MEIDENKKYDQALYFSDCIRTLYLYSIDKKLEELTNRFKMETDSGIRAQIAREMSELLSKKSKNI